MNNSKKNLWTLNFYFIDSQNYLHIMRIFLNHIKIETLDEIETSLENLWQQMIQLSEFFQYSFMLILKRKCLVRSSRVRSGESGTPSTIIYTRWSSRRYELGCDTPVCAMVSHGRRIIDTSIVSQSRVLLIRCPCKSVPQTANQGKTNAFLIKSSLTTC